MNIDDLSDLEDVLDDLSVDEEPTISDKDELECINTIMELMFEYIQENPSSVSEPDFEITMLENVSSLLQLTANDKFDDDFEDLLDLALNLFYLQIIPIRSHSTTFTRQLDEKSIDIRKKQIQYLQEKPQPEQRTPEWYSFRHKLLTASNAYKAFENDSVRNQLIYEKCQPLRLETEKVAQVNINSPFHHGQKFEPVSVMFYEDKYKTKIGDFGCIQHDTYSFIGASPDGINMDSLTNRYGRLLEIKNIVNREIDGIPKKEYWIQMQLQMETCNLDECDFLECRFTEYENENAFLNDGTFIKSEQEDCRKGVIIYFCNKEGNPKYIYMPFSIQTKKDFENWEQDTMIKYGTDYTWIRNIYWKLDEYSCVLVDRNKKWFSDNVGKLEEVWRIIEKERIDGFEHRSANKRIKKPVEQSNGIISSSIDGCFLKIVKAKAESDKVKSDTIPIIQTMKIRTESFDETKLII